MMEVEAEEVGEEISSGCVHTSGDGMMIDSLRWKLKKWGKNPEDEQFWKTMDLEGDKDGKIDQKEFLKLVTRIWNPIVEDRKYLGELFDKIKAPKSDVMTWQDIKDALMWCLGINMLCYVGTRNSLTEYVWGGGEERFG